MNIIRKLWKKKITYTDTIGLLINNVTTIVNIISYVLIAFVSISLVVSSIMIGIITYISVLLTMLGGLIYSKIASNKETVLALRAEQQLFWPLEQNKLDYD